MSKIDALKNALVSDLAITTGQADVLLHDWFSNVPESIRADYCIIDWYGSRVSSECIRAKFEAASVASAEGDCVRKLADGTYVKKFKLIGSLEFIYEAYRPTVNGGFEGYSSFFTVAGVRCGRVGTERLPDELDALPSLSAERSKAVHEWQQDRYDDAYVAINRAFPETNAGKRRAGEIVIIGS
jgi:hypothetical protein